MNSERIAAIILGLIMIFSLIGYGALNIITEPDNNRQTQIPYKITRPLKNNEKVSILRSGRVLIQDFYIDDPYHIDFNMVLENFTEEFKRYVVLEIVKTNETMMQMISPLGNIVELNINMTKDDLINIFCDISTLQPKECLLREM